MQALAPAGELGGGRHGDVAGWRERAAAEGAERVEGAGGAGRAGRADGAAAVAAETAAFLAAYTMYISTRDSMVYEYTNTHLPLEKELARDKLQRTVLNSYQKNKAFFGLGSSRCLFSCLLPLLLPFLSCGQDLGLLRGIPRPAVLLCVAKMATLGAIRMLLLIAINHYCIAIRRSAAVEGRGGGDG